MDGIGNITLIGYLIDSKIQTILYLILAFLFMRMILERRTYLSSDNKKMYAMMAIALLFSVLLSIIAYAIFGFGYLASGMNFYLFVVPMIYYNFVLFSVITFELEYDFYYLRTKLSLNNIYPYFILYGFLFAINFLLFNFNIGGLSIFYFIANIFYFGYLIKVIDSKGNIVRY